jgi:RNA polymerase sigma factor (sigma-70 family)
MAADFEHVYREHVTSIWRYVRARVPTCADAEDVTSEVFAKGMRSWDQFDPRRGSVGGWLVGIARHTLADWWRRQEREDPMPEVAEPEADSAATSDPEAAALRAHGIDELRRHLGRLTAKEREAVALRFGTDLSSEEIGAAMGISGTAARMLVYRAVGKLREVMTDG